MSSSFSIITINNNELTINGKTYQLIGDYSVVNTLSSSFKEISASDNGDGTFTLVLGSSSVILQKYELPPEDVLITADNKALKASDGYLVPLVLHTPSISRSKKVLSIEDADTAITNYDIYFGDSIIDTIVRSSLTTTYDLLSSCPASGTYNIKVIAKTAGGICSEASQSISYTVPVRKHLSVTVTELDRGTFDNPAYIYKGYPVVVNYTPPTGTQNIYKVPTNELIASGFYSKVGGVALAFNQTNNTLTITPNTDSSFENSGDVTINVLPTVSAQVNIVTLSHVTTSTVFPVTYNNWTASSYTFTATSGYNLPTADGVSVNVASSWNQSTGVLTLPIKSVPLNSITISITAIPAVASHSITRHNYQSPSTPFKWKTSPPDTVPDGANLTFKYRTAGNTPYAKVEVEGASFINQSISGLDPEDEDYGKDLYDYTCTYGPCYQDIDIYIRDIETCFAKDTKITLKDGSTKLAQDITEDDELLVWDFDNACFASAKPLWIAKGNAAIYNELVFSDGTVLNTVEDHRIFDRVAGRFSYVMAGEATVGTATFNDKGEEVLLVSKRIIGEPVEYYNIITDYHINLFANTILTSCRLSNLYPIVNMKYVKDGREPVDRSVYDFAPDKYFYGLRLAEQPVNNNGGIEYFPAYEDTKKYVKHLMETNIIED